MTRISGKRPLVKFILLIPLFALILMAFCVCLSHKDKREERELTFFLGRARQEVKGVYESPSPGSKRESFDTSGKVMAVFKDERDAIDYKDWYYVEEIGVSVGVMGYLPVDAIEIVSADELKRLYNADSEGFCEIGEGGLFKTFYIELEDLNRDTIREIILKCEWVQAPSFPRISMYEVIGGKAKAFIDKQLLGGKEESEFMTAQFLLKDIDRDSYKEILFFQPYGETNNEETEGLIIYKWDGKEYHSISRFTCSGLSLLFRCYPGYLTILVFFFLAYLLILFMIPYLEKKSII
jgi:hypothetical protein